MPEQSPRRWCVLIHALPARPLYLRARVRRQLSLAGAAPLKKAVYVIPHSEPGLQRLRAIAAEIQGAGAAAFVCEATFPDRETEGVVTRAYQHELQLRYREWMVEARSLATSKAAGPGQRRRRSTAKAPRASDPGAKVSELRSRLEGLRTLDLVDSPGSAEAVAMLADLERRQGVRPARSRSDDALVGLRWVTRRGLHVDRIACAWVVRRFIDPSAEFRFVASPEAALKKGEIGFDMPGAAITHESGLCSVEVLVRRAGVGDAAVQRIAEVVHDIDIKDGRHLHAETAGFEQLLIGTLQRHPHDPDRLEHGLALFDALYAATRARPTPTMASPPGLPSGPDRGQP